MKRNSVRQASTPLSAVFNENNVWWGSWSWADQHEDSTWNRGFINTECWLGSECYSKLFIEGKQFFLPFFFRGRELT